MFRKEIGSYILTFIVLMLGFLTALTLILLMPKLFVAFAGLYSLFVTYVLYIHAKIKNDVPSGIYDTCIFHGDDDVERHIK